MTNYTPKQVEEALATWAHTDAEGAWQWNEEWRAGERPLLDINGVVEYAEYVGGKQPEEGGGEYIFAVIKVGTQYFKKYGYYASHDGAYWDGSVEEVRPQEKTITVYEALWEG